MVAMAFNAKANDGLASRCNAFHYFGGPAVFNTDDHHSCHVRVAASANQSTEVQVQVGTKLQTAIRVRYRHAALDVVRHRLSGSVRQVVQRQNNHVVANTNAPVFTAVAQEGGVFIDN